MFWLMVPAMCAGVWPTPFPPMLMAAIFVVGKIFLLVRPCSCSLKGGHFAVGLQCFLGWRAAQSALEGKRQQFFCSPFCLPVTPSGGSDCPIVQDLWVGGVSISRVCNDLVHFSTWSSPSADGWPDSAQHYFSDFWVGGGKSYGGPPSLLVCWGHFPSPWVSCSWQCLVKHWLLLWCLTLVPLPQTPRWLLAHLGPLSLWTLCRGFWNPLSPGLRRRVGVRRVNGDPFLLFP